MKEKSSLTSRRSGVIINYLALAGMNVCFYFVAGDKTAAHWIDAVGLSLLAIVLITFVTVHWKTGLWKLCHTGTDNLDEREVTITHDALSSAYSWFSIICLVIMLVHAVFYRLTPGFNFIITVPLVGSLIYLAHTLPGSVLAWTQIEVPGEVANS